MKESLYLDTQFRPTYFIFFFIEFISKSMNSLTQSLKQYVDGSKVQFLLSESTMSRAKSHLDTKFKSLPIKGKGLFS